MNKKQAEFLLAMVQVTALVLFMLLAVVCIKQYQESKQMVNLGGIEFKAKDLRNIAESSRELGFKRIVVCDMDAIKCAEVNTGAIK